MLTGKIDSLRVFCRALGWSELVASMQDMTPLQGDAVESLQVIQSFVVPEAQRLLATSDIDAVAKPVLQRVKLMENILIDAATGGSPDGATYDQFCTEFMRDPQIRSRLPSFVRTCRTLSMFWPFIKKRASTYAERREIIGEAFTPLLDYLEGLDLVPSDLTTSDTLRVFDAEHVHETWSKALSRRTTDPEGAITLARTLLEAVTKHILDEHSLEYRDDDDLPKLYGKAAAALNLAPNQHSEEPIRRILGGVMSLVNGLGTLRNRLSDSHGRGKKLPVRPSQRHASLAVNAAGAVATFLVETHHERQK